MKKLLYFIISIAGLVYISLCALYAISSSLANPFMAEFFAGDFFQFILKWGAVICIGAFAFVNFFGKTLKLIFFFLLLVAIILYVLAVNGVFAG